MKPSPIAGKPADLSILVDLPRLVTAYYTEMPDPSVPAQRVAFGTSGHRGSSFDKAFNERHILAITQAICLYRAQQQIDGPLFLGMDTHALSVPACASALEVLGANGVDVMLAEHDEYTPTPAVSHAILAYNRGHDKGPADGIVHYAFAVDAKICCRRAVSASMSPLTSRNGTGGRPAITNFGSRHSTTSPSAPSPAL